MKKTIDIKNRVVDFYDINTGLYEMEIIKYLDRKMKVRFHSATFSNSKYVFIGDPSDHAANTITVNRYRKKKPGENVSIMIG